MCGNKLLSQSTYTVVFYKEDTLEFEINNNLVALLEMRFLFVLTLLF